MRPLHAVGDVIRCSLERRENTNRRKTRRNRRLSLPDLGAAGVSRGPPPEVRSMEHGMNHEGHVRAIYTPGAARE